MSVILLTQWFTLFPKPNSVLNKQLPNTVVSTSFSKERKRRAAPIENSAIARAGWKQLNKLALVSSSIEQDKQEYLEWFEMFTSLKLLNILGNFDYLDVQLWKLLEQIHTLLPPKKPNTKKPNIIDTSFFSTKEAKLTELKIIIHKILVFTIFNFLIKNDDWNTIKSLQKTLEINQITFFKNSAKLTLNLIPLLQKSDLITFSELNEPNEQTRAIMSEIKKLYGLSFQSEKKEITITVVLLLTDTIKFWRIWKKKYDLLKKYLPKLKVIEVLTLDFIDDYDKQQTLDLTNFEKNKNDFFQNESPKITDFSIEKLEEQIIQIINLKFEDVKELFLNFLPKFRVLEIDSFRVNGARLSVTKLVQVVKDPAFVDLLKEEGFFHLSVEALEEFFQWNSFIIIVIKQGLKQALDQKLGNQWRILKLYLDKLHVLYIEEIPIDKNSVFSLPVFFLFNDSKLSELNLEILKELKKIENTNDAELEKWLQSPIEQYLSAEWMLVRKVFDDLQDKKKQIISTAQTPNNVMVSVTKLFENRQLKKAHQLDVVAIEELKKLQSLSFEKVRDLFDGTFVIPLKQKKKLNQQLYRFLVPGLSFFFLITFVAAVFFNRVKN